MRTRILAVIAFMFALGASAAAAADPASPVGLWRTFDDQTGKPRGLIRIVERDGVYSGRIERGLAPADNAVAICSKCPGARKDQPFLGMVILEGLRKEGDEYVGGEILDPDNGRVYRCKAALLEQGRKLLVRGYIGVPAFGRSQTWVREE